MAPRSPADGAHPGSFELVVVSNRLPVDRVVDEHGEEEWTRSPGGLVAALEPVMRRADGVWVGWVGMADTHFAPFRVGDIDLLPVSLSEQEVREYYEGFANGTLWPLYHDVIAPPAFHREWWDSYKTVNRRFASAVASVAADSATVWVQDYQLQLVPHLLRRMRPDLVIGFFDHIPFPPSGIFAQLPWRRQILEGVLGADVIGFQRSADAHNFIRSVRRFHGFETRGSVIDVPLGEADAGTRAERIGNVNRRGTPVREVLARPFPISIDVETFHELARRDDIRARAAEIRADLGDPHTVMLGVDRLDYTKGIGHRLKAYGELLDEGSVTVEDVALVQVASPSRERVETYRQLRDEIELQVGRINGSHSTLGHTAIGYFHHGYPREEMVALYLAADVMLVTALRDGMNLVAKEYVASRVDEDGVLVLSEFAGASDELTQAILVNPHDIDGLKEKILQAIGMPPAERRRRMRSLRKKVLGNDVSQWSASFLEALSEVSTGRASSRRNRAETAR